MRRILLFVLSAAVIGCQDSTLGPVQTVDGHWSGVQNGFSLSFNVSQSDTLVSGNATIASTGGAFGGTVAGTFKYPTLSIVIHVDNFEDAHYDGTMSTTEAKIFGHLNGSGLNNVSLDVRKN